MYELLVVGSGPAGISAALYAKRGGVDTAVISMGMGTLEKVEKIDNYYGAPMSGKQLYEIGITQAENLGIDIINQQVVSIDYDSAFTVTTQQDKYQAKAVVLATGASRKRPNIAGVESFEGKGVSYCAVCDAFFYRGKDVVVIGDGEYAQHEASVLKNTSKSVNIINQANVQEITGDSLVSAIKLKNGETVPTDGVFIAMGVAGVFELASKMGAMTSNGRIIIDENCMTNIPGLYAAGDCTGGMLQIAKAVHEGAVAGMQAIKQIKK